MQKWKNIVSKVEGDYIKDLFWTTNPSIFAAFIVVDPTSTHLQLIDVPFFRCGPTSRSLLVHPPGTIVRGETVQTSLADSNDAKPKWLEASHFMVLLWCNVINVSYHKCSNGLHYILEALFIFCASILLKEYIHIICMIYQNEKHWNQRLPCANSCCQLPTFWPRPRPRPRLGADARGSDSALRLALADGKLHSLVSA